MPDRESDSIGRLSLRIRRFARARRWSRYHTPKNLSMSVAIEAGELMEQFQWTGASRRPRRGAERAALEGELADVAIYLLRLADVCGVDLGRAVLAKLRSNGRRFPAPLRGGKKKASRRMHA